MGSQINWLDDDWREQYEGHLQELLMQTSIARQRLTIAHLLREQNKEKSRYARLIQPKLKADSGLRVTMLRERLETNQDILRELLIEKGYLRGVDVGPV